MSRSIIHTAVLLVTINLTVPAAEKTYDIEHYDLEIRPDFSSKVLRLRAVILVDDGSLQGEYLFGIDDRSWGDHGNIETRPEGGVRFRHEVPCRVLLGPRGAPARAVSSGRRGSVIMRNSCATRRTANPYRVSFSISGRSTCEGMRVETVYLEERKTSCTFESRYEPRDILLDPNGWLLMKIVYAE